MLLSFSFLLALPHKITRVVHLYIQKRQIDKEGHRHRRTKVTNSGGRGVAVKIPITDDKEERRARARNKFRAADGGQSHRHSCNWSKTHADDGTFYRYIFCFTTYSQLAWLLREYYLTADHFIRHNCPNNYLHSPLNARAPMFYFNYDVAS